MDENWLQILEYDGQGFQPLVTFNSWRVAILNYLDEIHPERNDMMERHSETDEIFVLLKGSGVLLIGGNDAAVKTIFPQVMETGKIYNVRRATWHTILMSRDASVLLVENNNTGEHNSEYTRLSQEQRNKIIQIAEYEEINA